MKIYKCDGRNCKTEAGERDSWITIGSEDERSLCIENNTRYKGIIALGRHKPIHFCSPKCCIDYLFGDKLTVVRTSPTDNTEAQ